MGPVTQWRSSVQMLYNFNNFNTSSLITYNLSLSKFTVALSLHTHIVPLFHITLVCLLHYVSCLEEHKLSTHVLVLAAAHHTRPVQRTELCE